jgi:predicted dehydrogenase
MNPIVFGSAGLGGYARTICQRLLEHSRSGESGQSGGAAPPLRLAAVCEPDLQTHNAFAQTLRDAGVKVLGGFEDLLAQDEVQAVWLPLPIDLHRSFTERALAAGKAVMCEKPAAGCVDDVDAMIAARDAANLPAAIGFQDVYSPDMQDLKRRLSSGEFGTPTTATVIGCWPRNATYYGRNTWAGKLRRGDTWVLDSPANNALAHFIHLALFLLGPRGPRDTCATPVSIEAELYRANAIENYDTCSLRVTLDGGATLFVCFSHACATTVEPEIEIDTDRTQLRILPGKRLEIGRTDNGSPQIKPLRKGVSKFVAPAFAGRVRGDAEAPIATLEMARAHTLVVNGASEASPVLDVPSGETVTTYNDEDVSLRSITGIEAAMRRCVETRQMLHESRQLSWTARPGKFDLRGYKHFNGPAPARKQT